MRAKDRSNLSLKLKVFPHFFCLALAAHLTVRVNGLPVGTDILFGANGEKKSLRGTSWSLSAESKANGTLPLSFNCLWLVDALAG
jgi:hypothetical protein